MTLDFTSFIESPYAAYGCDSFGDDTAGNKIWDNALASRDLAKGDGSTSATFPTFVDNVDHATGYYSFDGSDDYVSNWPDITGDYTLSACFSSSYDGSEPYVTQCNDSTVKDLLTVGGAFTGNLHSLIVFDRLLTTLEREHVEWIQLHRLWSNYVVNPYVGRFKRESSCILYFPMWSPAYNCIDYGALSVSPSLTEITFDNGVQFSSSTSLVSVPDEAGLRSDVVSIFMSGELSFSKNETIVKKGSNYDFSVVYSGGNIALDFNGQQSGTVNASDVNSVAVTCDNGGYPQFYVNGKSIGQPLSTATVDNSGTADVIVGNVSSGSENIGGKIRCTAVFNEALSPDEIWTLHLNEHYKTINGYTSNIVIKNIDSDDTITSTQTNVTLSCRNAGVTEGKLYLHDAPSRGASSVIVEQSIDSWSDTSIQFDVVPGGL